MTELHTRKETISGLGKLWNDRSEGGRATGRRIRLEGWRGESRSRGTSNLSVRFSAGPYRVAVLCLLLGVGLVVSSVPAFAQAETSWTGTEDSDWSNGDNWSDGVPDSDTDAVIDTDDPNSPVVDGVAMEAAELFVGRSGTGDLIIRNGGTVSSGPGLVGNRPGSLGTVTVSGAGSAWSLSGDLRIGNEGSGTLLIENGGEVTNAIGYIGRFSGSTSHVTVAGTGSEWTNTAQLFVGDQGRGTLTVTDGGTVSSAGGTVGYFGTGTVTVAGAGSKWTNTGNLMIGQYGVEAGAGTVTITDGGTVDVTGAITIARYVEARGTLNIGAGAGEATSAAGTLNASAIEFGSGTGTINFNHTDDDYTFAPDIGGKGSVNVFSGTTILTGNNSYTGGTTIYGGILRAGSDSAFADDTAYTVNGGTLDLNDFDLTMSSLSGTGGEVALVAADLTVDQSSNTTFAGAITGGGSLTKAGRGTLTLTGDSTYTGGTTVNGGTLLIQGSLGETAVLVESGAALGGAGTIGGHVTVVDDGTLAPGNGVGTLTVSSLTLYEGANLDFDLGPPGVVGGTGNDLIVVQGDLTLDGALNVTEVGGFGDGVYRLINYGGELKDNGLDFGTLPGGVTPDDLLIQTSVDGQVNLVNGIRNNFWDGAGAPADGVIAGGDGVWSADNRNWATDDGAFNKFWEGYFAVFHGSPGTVTVDNSAGSISVFGMQFAVDGYRVEGDMISLSEAETVIRVGDGSSAGADYVATISSELTGTGGLVKDDLGTLVLEGANTYIGGTTIQGGTLEVSSDSNMGEADGTLTLNGGKLRYAAGFDTNRSVIIGPDGGTFDTNGHDAGLSGDISGDGGLAKVGAGTLTLSGVSTYAGWMEVHAGELVVNGPSAAINGSVVVYVGVASGENAALTVQGGGEVAVLAGAIGASEESEGSMTVTGSGSEWSAIQQAVGLNGTGSFTVAAGGRVTVGAASIGASAGSDGTVTVTGAGSTWMSSEEFAVGWSGLGTLTISDGGLVGVGDDGDGVLAVAVESGSEGTVNIGARVGDAAAAPGTLKSASVGFGDGVGTIVFNHTAADYTFASAITGHGSVEVLAGTTMLTGSNSYTGGTTVNGGTLRAGTAGAFADNTAYTVNRGTLDLGGFDLTMSSLSGTGGVVMIGAANLTIDQAGNTTYAGVISGTGDLTKAGSGTLILTGDSGDFGGSTFIEAGTLQIDGVLGGALHLTGGRLRGSGTVGSMTIASGSTVAPGASIGTLYVDGDITFEADSVYEVEVDTDGNSDRIEATGEAMLQGGSVLVLESGTDWALHTTYTILTADNGVNGTFDTVENSFAFLDPALTYGGNEVTLELTRNDVNFSTIGETLNQRETGAGVESLGDGNAVFDAVLVLEPGHARAAFDRLSGEIHATVQGALFDESRHLRDTVTDRLNLGFGQDGPVPGPPSSNGFAGLSLHAGGGRGLAIWGRVLTDENAAELGHSARGLIAGAQVGGLGAWRIGAAGGYSQSILDVKARASSASIDSLHAAAYGGRAWDALGLRLGAAYASHEVQADRQIAFPGFDEEVTAAYDAGTTQVFSELGYALDIDSEIDLEPFAALAYVGVDSDGFKERGGDAALRSSGYAANATYTTLGVRAATDFTWRETMKVRARGTLGWRHAVGDVTPTATVAFDGGDSFTVAGAPIAQDALVVDAGFGVDLSETLTLDFAYTGKLGGGTQEHGVKAGLAMRF